MSISSVNTFTETSRITQDHMSEQCGPAELTHNINHHICPYCLQILKLQYFGHLMRRADSFEKDPDAGKGWEQEEKGTTEDEMVGWHHRLDGHGFGWTLGVGDRQGGLAWCGSWVHKESDTTEGLNNWTLMFHIKLWHLQRSHMGSTKTFKKVVFIFLFKKGQRTKIH